MTGTTSRSLAVLLPVIVLVVACGTSGAPSQPAVVPWASSPDVAITPATASPTAAATPASPSPTATPPPPRPTPKLVPVPPKPTGLKFDVESEAICGDPVDMCGIGDTIYTLSWKAPRTKGIEIRVYGLLACLSRPENPSDSSDGPCLVKGTKLPSSAKKLIAKAKASDGVVSWRGDINAGGCDMAEQFIGPHGEVFYAIVLAAYNTAGKPSVFAIADPGEWWTPDPGDAPC